MTQLKGINPRVLRWARESSGYSVDEVARAIKRDIDVVLGWELGQGAPTYAQLENLAYQMYKRPLAVFFFPDPPEELDVRQSFRTLPDFELANLSADTLYAVRAARAMQIALYELNDGTNPSVSAIFRGVHFDAKSVTPVRAAEVVREYLGIGLAEQSQWKDAEEALERWRNAVQDKGIFVFKRSFKDPGISGICLHDPEFPVVYLNNSTPYTRQIFTIFHELAHLLLGNNGITIRDTSYVTALTGHARSVEVFCNRFAAEFLVPLRDFEHRLSGSWSVDELASALSNYYKVSREVILRRLLDRGLVSVDEYEARVEEWLEQSQKTRRSGAGGNYYNTHAKYLGDKYLELAFRRYYEGRCTTEQLADYLNAKSSSVPGFEEIVLRKALA